MKVPFKKPGHEVRLGSFLQKIWGKHSTFKYTEGHPMRIYKDKKKEKKNGAI